MCVPLFVCVCVCVYVCVCVCVCVCVRAVDNLTTNYHKYRRDHAIEMRQRDKDAKGGSAPPAPAGGVCGGVCVCLRVGGWMCMCVCILV
jgi:hypothetical protein